MIGHVRMHLLIAAVLYFFLALALFMGQDGAHRVLSTGPYDAVTNTMLGGAMLAFAVLFFMGVLNPVKALVNAAVAALGFLALVVVYLMFISASMPQHPATFFSFLITFTIGAILFFSAVQPPVSSDTRSAARSTRRPRPLRKPRAQSRKKTARRAPVRKKGAKKKVKKKTGLRRRRR